MQTIDVKELSRLLEQDSSIDLIDVRTPVEFREVHAERARNIPMDRLEPDALVSGQNGGGKTLYLICKGGDRSNMVAKKFVEAGADRVVSVNGGTDAWVAAGYPVVRGKKAMSLERQVRIAAGFLVFTGALLGFFVHPYLIGLSAFVGAGLMFAGITDTCAMGMLIAKMPWNQVPETCEV